MTDRTPFLSLVLMCLMTLAVAARPARAATAEQVDAAVDKAVKQLYAMQKDGLWELDGNPDPNSRQGPKGMHHGGLTAIAVYALLASGEKIHDPKLVKAVDFLKKLNTESVYVLGVRAQVWPFLGDTPEMHRLLAKDADLIVKQMKVRGKAHGMFYYPHGMPEQYDHSISQYAVLGLWSAIQNNVEVPVSAWDTMDQGWRAHQSGDGGWSYVLGGGGEEGQNTLSMTCAGVATLFITHDYVHAAKERGCAGNVADENIDRGLTWIGNNFDRLFQGGRDGVVAYYTLYGIERIGVAGGYKELGKTNWYDSGSNFLTTHQNPDGTWGGGGDIFGNNVANIPDTCFAVLFLAHGRAPAVINKLSYPDAVSPAKPAWNQRPRDVANIIRFTGHQVENPLKWHYVQLTAPISDLHDAPILYIAGSKLINFAPPDVAKIKQFVEDGGMVLANADCGSGEFARSIERLGAAMFPGYAFRDLTAAHPIFVSQQFTAKKFKAIPKLRGLSNGVRELLILIPDADPARSWQIPYQGNVEPFALATDIIEYATDRRGILERLPSPIIELDPKVTAAKSVTLARLGYDGNWDPEPSGWKRLAALLHNAFKLDLKIDAVKLGDGKLAGHKLAHLTGTAAITLTDPQRSELKAFIDAGGVLIVDAAGGAAPFADSMEKELNGMLGLPTGNSFGTPLKEADPLFTLPDGRIDKFRYRVFSRAVSTGDVNKPHLTAALVKGKPAIYFSRQDLSAGLVGQEVDGIDGYTPEVATAIVRNIVLRASR